METNKNIGANPAGKKFDFGAFFTKYMIYLLFVLFIIIMSILKPNNFPTWDNAVNIVRQMATVGIMALGITFCIITAGTDLSGSTVIALCSVVVAHMAHPNAAGTGGQYPLIVTILAPILVGGLAGLINGLVISIGHVPPFIGTLGMMSVAKGAAMLLSDSKPITGFTDAFLFIGSGKLFGVLPMPIVIYILCAVVAYILLHKTRYGTYVYAIGGNENAAMVSGVNVKLIKTMVYTFAGMFTGIAAMVITSRGTSGQPGIGSGYDMDAITCAIIGGASFNGGIGSIPGTVVGTLLIGVLTNAMTMLQIDPNWQMIVKGLVIVLAVLADEFKNRKK